VPLPSERATHLIRQLTNPPPGSDAALSTWTTKQLTAEFTSALETDGPTVTVVPTQRSTGHHSA